MNRAQSTLRCVLIPAFRGFTLTRNSSLEKLPQECLIQILDQLEPSDAASAGATSQSLQMPSEESLYRQVNLDWTRPPLKRVLSLFRVVNERPDLAMHIRHVRMISSRLEYPAEDQTEKWYPPPVDGNWELLAPSFQSEVHAAKEIVSQAQFPSPERWMQALDQGDPNAFVAITLSQLHNLRSLRLDYTFVWQSGFPGLMIRHALLSAPPDTLSKFAELSLVEYGLKVPCSRVSQGNPSDCIDLSKMGHLAKLERLVIMESYIDEDEVRDLLSLLSSIQSLHLGLVYPSQDETANWEIESPRPPLRKQMKAALLEGLMSIKGTVQNLSISIELCPINLGSQWYEKDFGDIEQALVPFRGFLKQYLHLETAELPAALLFGWVHDNAPNLDTLLPSTLQSLAIRENLSCVARDISVIEDGSPGETYEWELDAVARAIQRFLPSARDSTPLLNKIIIRDFAMDSRGHIAEENTLAARSFCQDLGLDMDIAISPDALPAGLWAASRALDEYSTSWRSKRRIIADSPFC
ncbi:unnamed protein product [Penicillium pancosmium]